MPLSATTRPATGANIRSIKNGERFASATFVEWAESMQDWVTDGRVAYVAAAEGTLDPDADPVWMAIVVFLPDNAERFDSFMLVGREGLDFIYIDAKTDYPAPALGSIVDFFHGWLDTNPGPAVERVYRDVISEIEDLAA